MSEGVTTITDMAPSISGFDRTAVAQPASLSQNPSFKRLRATGAPPDHHTRPDGTLRRRNPSPHQPPPLSLSHRHFVVRDGLTELLALYQIQEEQAVRVSGGERAGRGDGG